MHSFLDINFVSNKFNTFKFQQTQNLKQILYTKHEKKNILINKLKAQQTDTSVNKIS